MRTSLRASSPIWSSEASLARTRERAAKHRLSEELKELCHEIYQHSNSKKCHQIVRNTKITIHSPFKPSNLWWYPRNHGYKFPSASFLSHKPRVSIWMLIPRLVTALNRMHTFRTCHTSNDLVNQKKDVRSIKMKCSSFRAWDKQ